MRKVDFLSNFHYYAVNRTVNTYLQNLVYHIVQSTTFLTKKYQVSFPSSLLYCVLKDSSVLTTVFPACSQFNLSFPGGAQGFSSCS